jgi:hypothetical protein
MYRAATQAVIIGLTLFWVSGANVNAQVITGHFFAMTSGGKDIEDAFAISANTFHDNRGNGSDGTEFARTDPFASDMLHAKTTMFSGLPDPNQFIDARAAVGYRDFVTAHGQAPPALRFSFHVDGSFDDYLSSLGTLVSATSVMTVSSVANKTNEFEGYTFQLGLGNPGTVNHSIGLSGDRRTIIESGPRGINYDYSINVNYDPIHQGYRFATIMEIKSEAFASGANAVADFGQTLTFTGLALPDGTPLNVNDYTFESGISFAPVPEPSSLVLVAAAITGLLVGRRRRGSRSLGSVLRQGAN